MVETHVTGLASLWLARFYQRESMPCVAGITGGIAEHGTLRSELRDFFCGFQTDFVATATALHSFDERHWLLVNGWHGPHRCPGGSMFAFAELRQSVIMAPATGLCSQDLNLVEVRSRLMCSAVTVGAVNFGP